MSTDPFGPKRDQWGRYLLPDPETGKERSWTRATTLAGTLADTYGLTRWQMRMVAKGLGMRPDLLALAAAAHVDDKTTLDRVATDAKEAAGSSAGANSGTAVHAFTEAVDRGEEPVIPEPWSADVAAYVAAMDAHGIRRSPDWIERITVCPRFNVAGTFDRILTLADGRQVIGDVKTGRDLSYSWGDIAVQLALYANATHMWSRDHWVAMPEVDRSEAIVIWLPVGRAHCELHSVNIVDGWEMAQVAFEVRKWRARRNLARQLVSPTDVMDKMRSSLSLAEVKRQVSGAISVDELTQIWVAADAAGLWTTALTTAAAARKKVLTDQNQPDPTQPELEESTT